MTLSSVWLPWAFREVQVGDVLSYREVLELVVVQRGTYPLYPVPEAPGASTFQVGAEAV